MQAHHSELPDCIYILANLPFTHLQKYLYVINSDHAYSSHAKFNIQIANWLQILHLRRLKHYKNGSDIFDQLNCY